jgi:predicted phage baseplate assembly protein
VSERLGSGDATSAFQKFALPKAPLTYRSSASSVTGTAELEVRVSGERWTEVPSLFGRKPGDRVYTARQNDAGETTITFGDGRTGARVRTGAMNVEAAYRTGSGLAGRLRAGQLSIPLERPVGLREVTNPFAAEGGADPETRDKARAAGPASVRAFGRAVSLRDFEALALESGLVAKASAAWVWRRLERAAHLTVAGEGGAPLGAAQRDKLKAAIDAARDPNRPFMLAEFCPAPVLVSVRVLRDPAYTKDDVAKAARAALEAHLAFDARGLGEPLHASNVLTALQSTTGVRAVDVELFHFKGWTAFTAAGLAARLATADKAQPHLLIRPARPRPATDAEIDPITAACFPDGPPAVLPAEIAVVEDASTDLTVTVVEAL